MSTRRAIARSVAAVLAISTPLSAHESGGHGAPTYEVTPALAAGNTFRILRLRVLDDTGANLPARFHLTIDDAPYTPAAVGAHGLRFTTVHTKKDQRFTACYTRGTGAVEVPLPGHGSRATVTAIRGIEYLPVEQSFELSQDKIDVTVRLHRWSDLGRLGWVSADAHLHYDRLAPAHDGDWLALLAAEDLTLAHFLVLRGGNLPGVWAQQYGYGPAGEATDGQRRIRPGEEYRDRLQGHVNLLGVDEVIPPMSTGGLGDADVPYHWPALHDVLLRARALGGLVGPAHGTALGRSPTGLLDTVLGAVDFFEIANTHLYHLDAWYRLLNCGFITPPAAGTDLPNYPFREPWQPLLGETRMYVRTGPDPDFEEWKAAVVDGRVFVSSGPLITLAVAAVDRAPAAIVDAEPGDTVNLPPEGGELLVHATLSGPRPLSALELVRDGQVVATDSVRSVVGEVHRWELKARLRFTVSGWFAALGSGGLKTVLREHTGIAQRTIAHTAPIRVLVGQRPIRSPREAGALAQHLRGQRQHYRDHGVYERDEQREYVSGLFDSAIARLEAQRESIDDD